MIPFSIILIMIGIASLLLPILYKSGGHPMLTGFTISYGLILLAIGIVFAINEAYI